MYILCIYTHAEFLCTGQLSSANGDVMETQEPWSGACICRATVAV